MAPKSKTLRFALTEDGNSVRAVLAMDGSRILEFENREAPRATVRHPRANEKELLETAAYWSRRDRAMKGRPGAVLDAYVASREKDVAKQILEIRKALRKIAGSMRNANVARKLKRDCEGDA